MTLIEKLPREELDLLEVVEDPIWFGEFLRSTHDASSIPQEWPSSPFHYRWYQKDILSDKNPYISLTGGRAIGKCSPLSERVYTYPYGYMKLMDLYSKDNKHNLAIFYVRDREDNFIQRRGEIHYNSKEYVYEVKTESNHKFKGTAEHPIWTPNDYINIENLEEGMEVGVAALLPHQSEQSLLSWEELRWLGMVCAKKGLGGETPIVLKNYRQKEELEIIAEFFGSNLHYITPDVVKMVRRIAEVGSYGRRLYTMLGIPMSNIIRELGFLMIPPILKAEKLSNLKIFMESFLSHNAEISEKGITINFTNGRFAEDIQEILLRFGIETKITEIKPRVYYKSGEYIMKVSTFEDYCRVFHTFSIPGIEAVNVPDPGIKTEAIKYEKIISIERSKTKLFTYAVSIPIYNNYISGNFFVHNSLVIEDSMVYDAVNSDLVFPDTKEQLLATPNNAQLTPIQNRLFLRFVSSKFLSSFLGHINKSRGTMEFPIYSGSVYILNMRIAGKTGETNFIGLHLPRMVIDESQIFPMSALIQMQPAFNSWERNTRQMFCGVPNGMRDGNVLFYVDQRSKKFKKYRVPSHENPFFTEEANIDSLIQYGGEDSEDYLHLVLGRHGNPVFHIIPRDKIFTEPFDFYNGRYTQEEVNSKISYKQILDRPSVYKKPDKLVASLDTGYVDPTILQIFAWYSDEKKWRVLSRYQLIRIPFPKQAEIIDWIDSYYDFDYIVIDHGAGGGGIGLSQDLLSAKYGTRYKDKVHGVQFQQLIPFGEEDGVEMKLLAKSFAGSELAKMITSGEIILSELDRQGISQLERVSYARSSSGVNQYFILSENGKGKSGDDHIFACYIVFIISLQTVNKQKKKRKKLFTAKWI